MSGFTEVKKKTTRRRRNQAAAVEKKENPIEELGDVEQAIYKLLKASPGGKTASSIAKHRDLKDKFTNDFGEPVRLTKEQIGYYLYETPLKHHVEKSAYDHLWRAK